MVLRQNSAELFLLMRARDEAHRFAVGFHRKNKRKTMQRSELDDIPGIGKARRQALLRKFGSVTRLRQRSQEELAEVVGEKLAEFLYAALRSNENMNRQTK